MKKTIFIAIAISVYMTLSVVTNHVANRHTVVTADVTLDLIEVMTLAFDEGGEGGQGCSPAPCDQLEYQNLNRLKASELREMVVVTDCGVYTGPLSQMPQGLTFSISYEDQLVGYHYYCGFNLFNKCCVSSMGMCYFVNNNNPA